MLLIKFFLDSMMVTVKTYFRQHIMLAKFFIWWLFQFRKMVTNFSIWSPTPHTYYQYKLSQTFAIIIGVK